jgi:hypothetical protein
MGGVDQPVVPHTVDDITAAVFVTIVRWHRVEPPLSHKRA